MVGWYHRLNGHEFEQAPGNGEGQGSLACCSPWDHKELDTTERLNNSNDQPCLMEISDSQSSPLNWDFLRQFQSPVSGPLQTLVSGVLVHCDGAGVSVRSALGCKYQTTQVALSRQHIGGGSCLITPTGRGCDSVTWQSECQCCAPSWPQDGCCPHPPHGAGAP